MNSIVQKLLALVLCTQLMGCNIFELVDIPNDDEEYISRAKACLDQRDHDCAREYYKKISDKHRDERNFGLIVTTLDEQDVDMEDIAASFGAGNKAGGALITSLVNRLATTGHAERKKNAIAEAYKMVPEITGNAQLRGLARFTVAIATMALLLVQAAGDDGELKKSDLVTDWPACESSGLCTLNTSRVSEGTAQNPEPSLGDGSVDVSGGPDLDKIQACANALSTALSDAELGATGKFSESTKTLASNLTALDPDSALSSNAYITVLVRDGLGDYP